MSYPNSKAVDIHGSDDDITIIAQLHDVSNTQKGKKLAFLTNQAYFGMQLYKAHQNFIDRAKEEFSLPLTAEWLLDNFYIVQQAIVQIEEDMPSTFYQQLPVLKQTNLAGYPRVVAIAQILFEQSETVLDIKHIQSFLHKYQQIRPLAMGEIWALPAILRIISLENLTWVVSEVTNLPFHQPEYMLPVSPSNLDTDTIVANEINNLRTLSSQDWKTFFKDVSLVEDILRQDPLDVYQHMDFKTQNHYRKQIEYYTAMNGEQETAIAQLAVDIARNYEGEEIQPSHVGYYLLGDGQSALESKLQYQPPLKQRIQNWLRNHNLFLYLTIIFVITLVILLMLLQQMLPLSLFEVLGLTVIVVWSISSMVIGLVNNILTNITSPAFLPRLDHTDAEVLLLPTAVVIPALLTDIEEVDSLVHQLEQHYLRNSGDHLRFVILADYRDAKQQILAEDKIIWEYARDAVQALNECYNVSGHAPFYILLRERLWNEAEQVWMAWERKRGKLSQFNRFLLNPTTDNSFIQIEGDVDRLQDVRYVITLDADTLLPLGSANRLIATMLHPLNQPIYNSDKSRVIGGYVIMQPRVQITPQAANQTLFTRIFADDTTLDLYTLAVSDVYQDIFGEGTYVGKGIYDVQAFEDMLTDRVPENRLLSHDLFESIYARTALVTDIVLLEDYPPHFLAYMLRVHRWVRGDWQLLPFLFNRDAKLSRLGYWKITDNLRRSLVAPSLLFLLITGWTVLPGSALFWTVLAIFVSGFPFLISTVNQLLTMTENSNWNSALHRLANAGLRWFLSLAFLPHESFINIDAIITTLSRLVSNQNLLQWVTASHTTRLFGSDVQIANVYRHMQTTIFLVIVSALLILFINPSVMLIAAPLLICWLISLPLVVHLSRTRVTQTSPLSNEDKRKLRRTARRTWLFFEQYVNPKENWLPPDHYQESPREITAHHTSPTNIGLFLVCVLAAYDFGYIGLPDLLIRLQLSLESMKQLERYRGHFLNWYDTRRLVTLSPRYVSTVDSGNLAGLLIALKTGLDDVRKKPLLRVDRWVGFADTLDLLIELLEKSEIGQSTDDAIAIQKRLVYLRDAIETENCSITTIDQKYHAKWQAIYQSLSQLLESDKVPWDQTIVHEFSIYIDRIQHHLENITRDTELFLQWRSIMDNAPKRMLTSNPQTSETWEQLQILLQDIPNLEVASEIFNTALELNTKLSKHMSDEIAVQWNHALESALQSTLQQIEQTLADVQQIQAIVDEFITGMDFSFVFNDERKIFHIGYNLETQQLDNSFYDLLASESRIGSVVAIATNQIPEEHWLHLSRPIINNSGMTTLVSWSGTMFEYLMPRLLMRSYPDSLIDFAYDAAVRYQIAYADQHNVPWGISESGYYTFDSNMNYQYRAFGAPALAFKRGMADDMVIAPYATFLALPIDPQAVIKNAKRLDEVGAYGLYGYYEALDYTGQHLPIGQNYAIVKEYMAHHQGMIFVALLNFLHDDVIVSRFHANPYIESVELLLQEGLPNQYQKIESNVPDVRIQRTEEAVFNTDPWQPNINAPVPEVHTLSNGRYSLLITSTGGGYNQWNDLALSRWYADTTQENSGTWIYLKDQDTDAVWSIGRQPINSHNHQAWFDPHQAVFRTEAHDIVAQMSITVAYDDDVEVRRIRLTNQSDKERKLYYTSYTEVALAPRMSDHRHPAFSKLFIETEYLPDIATLLYYRRKRSPEDSQPFMLHMLVDDQTASEVVVESDRRDFIGHNGSYREPRALGEQVTNLDGVSDITIDPIMALGKVITLAPHESIEFAYITMAGDKQANLIALAKKYRTWSTIDYTFVKARYQSELELQRIEVDSPQLQQFQKLLSALLYPQPNLRADSSVLAKNQLGQSSLWAHGISGDHPICLVKLSQEEELSLIQELLKAHLYWRRHNIAVTLVILNQRDSGYTQKLYNSVHRLVRRMNSDTWINRHDGIFILRADQMDENERDVLAAAARVYLDAASGVLEQQLKLLPAAPIYLPTLSSSAFLNDVDEHAPKLQRSTNLLFDNGFGGFDPVTGEYVIYRTSDNKPPAPWTNVIANADFGFTITESGGGFTWAVNSSENRLTTWRNDPVEDAPSEIVYIRDEETGNIWTTTPLPASDDTPFLVKHGKGYSTFENVQNGIELKQTVFIDPDDPVKVIRLQCKNHWTRNRRLTLTYYAEWVLGTLRGITQQYIIPEYDTSNRTILAHNPYSLDFGDSYLYVSASQEFHGMTTDRREFLGRLNDYREPSALRRVGLESRVNAGDDTCAVIQLHVDIEPDTSKEVYFIIGGGVSRSEAIRLSTKYQNHSEVKRAWNDSKTFWDKTVHSIEVETPEPSMNVILPWLLYQALSCRIWGRSALYQSGGAFGFRDQLQDVMSVIHAHPKIARDHILRAARHQFEEGDVLHWWHPPSDRGVRTHFSDDLIWLPFVTAYYVKGTGDTSILKEETPFLQGEPLKPDEDDRYGYYESGKETYTLYEHCRRALEHGTTFGRHGLPLMGSGDWNDGMSRVGVHGEGESVWVAWFLCATMQAFIPLCEIMSDSKQIAQYQSNIEKYQKALETKAWDGAWYRRAYYDDGTPLGSVSNDECKIDSIAQSWSIISGVASPDRAKQAMESVLKHLYKPNEQLLLLFTPPFDKTDKDPGYIKGYPPGVRENGGQYTHAAIWTAWALAQMGEGNQAEALFRLLNPILHSRTKADAESYRVEPYVIAADVYSVDPYVGMGGWTWYTGSSGWMYRLGVEAILGIEREGDCLIINPTIPKAWQSYKISYHYQQATYEIQVENPDGVSHGVLEVIIDGERKSDLRIPLSSEEQVHQVTVTLGE